MDDARIDDVLKKIECIRQARRHKFYLRDEKITLSHGSGGKATHNLSQIPHDRGQGACVWTPPQLKYPKALLWFQRPTHHPGSELPR
jgi:hypothetical protein